MKISSNIMGALIKIAYKYVKFSRSKRTSTSCYQVMIIMPGSEGSLGDEAMLLALTQELARRGCHHVVIVVRDNADRWQCVSMRKTIVSMQRFYAYRSKFDEIKFSLVCKNVDHIYLIGADALDGFYSEEISLGLIRLAHLGALLGVPTTITGFSINERPTLSSLTAIHNLPQFLRVLCRDPISLQRLSSNSSRSYETVADVAFLLEPQKGSDRVNELCGWMESMRKSGKIVMLVNISHLFQRKFRAFAESAILDVYSDALKRLIQVRPETVILLVPHDKRGEFSDDIMAKQLFENIVSEYGKNVMIAPLLSAPEIKALAGCADVAFSGRMHLAIACLGQGIPVGCLEYQGKFEGLLKHFDLPELRIDSNKTFNSENLLNTICVLIDKRNMLKAKVESALPNIKELALANFKT